MHRAFAGCLLGIFTISSVVAAEFYYDPNRTNAPGWNLADSCWGMAPEGPYDQIWADENSAVFEFSDDQNVTLDDVATVVVTGLNNQGGRLTVQSRDKVRTLMFANANIETADNLIRFSSALALKGSFTLTGGDIEFGAPGSGYYTGLEAVTIHAGNIYLGNNQNVDSYDVTVTSLQGDGGAIRVRDPKEGKHAQSTNRNSAFTINAGNLYLGNDQSNNPYDATVTSLQGSGGAITVNAPKPGRSTDTAPLRSTSPQIPPMRGISWVWLRLGPFPSSLLWPRREPEPSL
jgi:hypothetical protein